MAQFSIPEVHLSSGNSCRRIPVLGLGTAAFPNVESEIAVQAVLEAIKLGMRHFDTAAIYLSEGALGEAVAEATKLGLIKSRDEVFITTKLWCSSAHDGLVVPALEKSLRNLKMEYVDLYLIHWPVSSTPGTYLPGKQDLLPLNTKAVWAAMEECQKLGLTKSIGVCNFSCKKLSDLLAFAEIPPSINQVEMNPLWQQNKLIEFCRANGVLIEIYSPLGAIGNSYGTDKVMENKVLKEIAEGKKKSVAQICLRWAYEQDAVVLFKSYNKERLKQNLEIFNWELSEEETRKIGEIPQSRLIRAEEFVSENGPYKSVEEFWDGEI